MSDDDDTVPATASEVAAGLKGGDIDALVELAKTLQEKTGDREFVESMLILITRLGAPIDPEQPFRLIPSSHSG
jgi:hypothetical protein